MPLSTDYRSPGLRRARLPAVALPAVLAFAFAATVLLADTYEQEPINYSGTAATDPVARLQQRLDAGQSKLDYVDGRGYLDSVLRELDIPASSQSLVFSKTSFQRELISPKNPRALYFNDDVYIGWVRRGEVLEVASTDPQLGPVFYTLDQQQADKPRFVRQNDDCLQCHAGSMTRDTPGLMVRSVFPDRRGLPILTAGTHLTTHESPLKERWGGWYVTGTGGAQPHMGNFATTEDVNPDGYDNSSGLNVTTLEGKFDPAGYLSPHSDIVALMVLNHQAEMHNRITRANYLTRLALRDEQVMNEALGRPKDYRSESTLSRIKSAGEPLVQYLLFSGEAALTDPVEGTTDFAEEYPAKGPRDGKGRSLRDLDLTKRLLKYPCSPLIYSEGFDGLPDPMKEYVYKRLWEVLTGKDRAKEFAHLSADDRKAIVEILAETKKGLPAYWKLPA